MPLAALPYQAIPPLELGPLKFYPFGFLVGIAIIFGTVMASKRATKVGLDEKVVAELALWAIIPGMIGAHLYSAIFYFPEKIADDWLYLFKIWDGISSFGGFIGGTLGVIGYLKRSKIPVWPYADTVIWGFAFAWIFGRTGCTVAFDHPGLVTDFAMGMPYPWELDGEPPGTIRHNLGFYEMLYTLFICGVFWLNRKRALPAGWFCAVALLLYTPVRFSLDFLRAADKHYLGLTAGQYAAIGFFVLALWFFLNRVKKGELVTPIDAGPAPAWVPGGPPPPGRPTADCSQAPRKRPGSKAAPKGSGRMPSSTLAAARSPTPREVVMPCPPRPATQCSPSRSGSGPITKRPSGVSTRRPHQALAGRSSRSAGT